MAQQRQIDIYSAGCPVCLDAIERVRRLACPSCNLTVRDMKDPEVAAKAGSLGIGAVPAIVIDGELADCCRGGAPNAETLRAAGIGTPLS